MRVGYVGVLAVLGGAGGFYASFMGVLIMPILVVMLILLVALMPRGIGFVATMSFSAAFIAGFLWVLVPARARCQPPGCQIALTPLQDVAWLLGLLAVPIIGIFVVLTIRDIVGARRRREAGAVGP